MNQAHAVGQRLVETMRRHKAGSLDLSVDLEAHWSPECLSLLLDSDDEAVVEAAVSALGEVGSMAEVPPVARMLKHDSPAICSLAEDALWSIFFRAGGKLAHAVLTRIAESIDEGETVGVIPLLTELIRSQPAFAEAHHQRAQAYYLSDQFDAALRDATRACKLNQHHFAALALRGHCFAALGRHAEATAVYQDVLRLHPRMDGIRRAIRQLRERNLSTAR